MHYFISYMLFYVLNKTIIDHWFRHCHWGRSFLTSPQLLCDVRRTWGTCIVTSYLYIVLARANWRKGDLHYWITTMNIDFLPPSIHSLAFKKHTIIHTWAHICTCLHAHSHVLIDDMKHIRPCIALWQLALYQNVTLLLVSLHPVLTTIYLEIEIRTH